MSDSCEFCSGRPVWTWMKIPLLFFVALAVLGGCSSATLTARKGPKADLSHLKHLFVEHRLNDNHRLDELIVQELRNLGYDVASGPLTMMPKDADALITYEDEWTFDFSTHLTGFTLLVGDNVHPEPIAEAHYSRLAVTHMSPADMVRLTVAKLFKPS